MILKLVDVGKRYASLWALRGVCVQLEASRIGLWGANSAGKSTLMRLMLGLLTPDEGRIEVLGMDVAQEPQAVRRAVGWMTDSGPILPRLKAIEAVVLAAELAGLPSGYAQAQAHRMLDYVGLGEARNRAVSGFSKGMRQRVALAQAMVGEPRLLLLDEPTEGLDPSERAFVLRLIDDFARSTGAAFVLSSHVLADVQALCTHAIRLEAGSLQSAGPLAKADAAAGRYVVRVEGDLDLAATTLRQAGLAVEQKAQHLLVRLTPLSPTDVLRHLSAAGLGVRHLAPAATSQGGWDGEATAMAALATEVAPSPSATPTR